ncbi:hypothetical protein [Pantoea allii]|uniref:hypothetical protein n=1 Tax=Pantoea allii TaxID=574096 RepID=UPI0024B7F83B|nr:hypothetical protein [Pantoea allii]MDJ0041214.1 hypothetical protein [Pantoea allii]
MDGFQGATGRTQPETRIQLVRLSDDQKQAVMIHQVASVPARDAGALFVKAASYGAEIKAVIHS